MTKIRIRSEWWGGPRQCCRCGWNAFVASGSDGHFYCETCRSLLVMMGLAEIGGWHTAKPHLCNGWDKPLPEPYDLETVEPGELTQADILALASRHIELSIPVSRWQAGHITWEQATYEIIKGLLQEKVRLYEMAIAMSNKMVAPDLRKI